MIQVPWPDSHEPAADAAEVFKRARALATLDPAFPGLPDIVESTYRILVAGFVAADGALFPRYRTD